VFAAAVAAIALSDPTAALYLGPLLTILAILLVGVYPGARAIARLYRRRRRPRRTPAATIFHRAPRVPRRVGLEFAFALASRPPPALAFAR